MGVMIKSHCLVRVLLRKMRKVSYMSIRSNSIEVVKHGENYKEL